MHASVTIMLWALLASPSDGSITIHTRSGDTLVCIDATWTSTGLLVHHPTLGMLELPAHEILDASERSAATAQMPPTIDPAASLPGRAFIATGQTPTIAQAVLDDADARVEAAAWSGAMGAALTASRTSQETWNMRLSGRLGHSDASGSVAINGSWYLNIADGAVTDNDMLVRGDQQWFLPDSPWQWFLQGTWQYDQFETWAHRVSPYTGVGLSVIDNEQARLTLKGGGGATWEYGPVGTRPQAIFEADGRLAVTDLAAMKGYASIAPNVRAIDDYLATLKLVLELRLDASSPMAINVGVRNIYDSTPGAGATHNDLKLWTGLDWTF